jgi:hypothetical protein
MKDNDKLDTFLPKGKLFVRDLTYFYINCFDVLTNPGNHEFLVVPFDPVRPHVPLSGTDDLFGWARHIVISGDFLIEYGACNKIQCMLSPEEW